MAEKRVSVRLGAVGGRQVRSELEGVGKAGERGFKRLSREMEAANKRLARFARRAKVVGAAIATATAAAGAALIRSGLQTIDAQAKLAQSLETTTASVQVLARAAELSGSSFNELQAGAARLTRRLSLFATDGGGPAADAIERLGLNVEELLGLPLDQRIARVTEAIRDNASASEQAAFFSQLFGDRAFVAFQRLDPAQLREANDELRRFGVLVGDRDADQIETTNDAISRLGLLWRGLSNQLAVSAAPALQKAAEALARMGEVGGPIQRVFTALSDALVFLIDNFARLASIATAFAVFLAGRFVGAFLAAAVGVRGLATALVVLRRALVRTGIGALIVGAGELIFQFTRVAEATGGIGNALRLLRRVAAEAWRKISLSAQAGWTRVSAGWADLQASILKGLQRSTEAVTNWANSTIGTFRGAFDAVAVIWGALPDVIGEVAISAANRMLGGIESMLNGAIKRIDAFTGRIREALAAVGIETTFGRIGQIDLGDIPNPFEGAAAATGEQIASAVREAMDRTFVTAPDLFGGMAEDARGRASGFREAGRMLRDAAARPLAAWQELRDALARTGEDGAAALDEARKAARRAAQALADAGATGGKAGDDLAAGTDKARTGLEAITGKISDYARETRDIGGDIGQSLVGAFQSAETAVAEFVKTGKLKVGDLVTSVIADLAKLGARRFILGPIAGAFGRALGALGPGGVFADVLHAGGVAGAASATGATGPSRMVPALAFAGAPRMHRGGAVGLRHDEVPAILQRGERVLSRREAQSAGATGTSGAGGVNITIVTRDAESFRQSRTQVASDIARAVSLGRRGL